MINFQDNKYIVNSITVLISYYMLWVLAWLFSNNFSGYVFFSPYFIPAGIRMAYLLKVDKQYWPYIFIGEILGIYSIFEYHSLWVSSMATYNIAIVYLSAISVYMLSIHLTIKFIERVSFESFRNNLIIFSSIFAASICVSFILNLNMLWDGRLNIDRFWDSFIIFILGDIVGIWLIVPLVYIFSHKYHKLNLTLYDLVFVLFNIVIGYMLLHYEQANYLKVYTFIPIIFFAYRFGWLGAAITIVVANIVLAYANYEAIDNVLIIEKQLYLIIITIVGLLLGALVDQQKSLNEQLILKNNKLLDSLHQNRKLATKVINVQESERKSIARELHDEMGQNLTAIKLHVSALRQLPITDKARDLICNIDDITARTYDSAYALMRSLRPLVLDDIGLVESLKSNAFSKPLKLAGIKYNTKFDISEDLLSDSMSITLYRISQECINNVIKHSNASNLWLSLTYNDHHYTLEVADDGVGFDVDQKSSSKLSGFGIEGIKERVLSLSGEYILHSDNNGTKHTIHLPISD